MSSFLDEREADAEVIRSLERTIYKLKEKLAMGQVIKSTDGNYYEVEDDQQLSQDQVTALIASRQAELQRLEAIAPTPAADPTPADQSAPAPQPSAPAEQPAVPANPADSGAAPASGPEAAPLQ